MNSFFKVQPENNSLICVDTSTFESFFSFSYTPSLFIESPVFLKNLIQYTPLSLKFFSFYLKKNFKTHKDFLNLKKNPPSLSIQFINSEIGYGAFAETFIPKGSFVREYAGKLTQSDFFNVSMNPYCMELPVSFFSPFYFMIDAQKLGNESRFFNHSDTPNLLPCYGLDNKTPRIFFLTKKDILKGEELRFNYGYCNWKNNKI